METQQRFSVLRYAQLSHVCKKSPTKWDVTEMISNLGQCIFAYAKYKERHLHGPASLNFFLLFESEIESCSVVLDSLQHYALYRPWNSLGQNTGVVAFPFSRGSLQPRDWTQVSCIAGRFFTSWATIHTIYIFIFDGLHCNSLKTCLQRMFDYPD